MAKADTANVGAKPRKISAQPTVDSYRSAPMYVPIVDAVVSILDSSNIVAPDDVLLRMGKLARADRDAWRAGRVDFLERVIHGNLSQLRMFLRILRFHAHDLNLVPSLDTVRDTRGRPLRFTKNGEPRLERAYATRFTWPGRAPFPMDRARPPG